jgi:hypothetical protein
MSSYIEQNPVRFKGLGLARELIQKLSMEIVDEDLDDNSIVAISCEIDYLLVALRGLAEANTNTTLDDELQQLLSSEE